MRVPFSVCQLLAKANPNYRYGLAWLPGQGHVFCLCILTTKEVGGADDPNFRPGMTFYPHDLKSRWLGLQDENGNFDTPLPAGKVPVILGFPGQSNSFRNSGVSNGDHAAFLLHYGQPLHVVQTNRREIIRGLGRDMDNHIEGEGRELADYTQHLMKDPLTPRVVSTNEDMRKGYNDPANAEFFLTHDKAYENSFEAEALRDAGLK